MSQKLLVIDDSRTVRTVVEWVFHGSPYKVVGAPTASEGLRLARSERPVAILVDYALPDQGGYELCAELRRDPALRNTPVVMLGGTWAAFDERRAAAVGADDTLIKPFKTDALLDKVASAISRAANRPVQLTPDDLPSVPSSFSAEPVAPAAFAMPGLATGASHAPSPYDRPAAAPAQQAAPALAGAAPHGAPGFRRVATGTSRDGGPGLPAFSGAPALPELQPLAMPAGPALRTPTPLPEEPDELELVDVDDEPAQPGLAVTQPTARPTVTPAAPLALEPLPAEPLPLTQTVQFSPQPVAESVAPALAPRQPTPAPAAPAYELAAPVAVAAAPSPAPAAPVQIDEETVKAVVRELLPAIVKDVLAGLLRQTIGVRVEQYASKKIDEFVETDLPAMAERSIEARLAALYDQA